MNWNKIYKKLQAVTEWNPLKVGFTSEIYYRTICLGKSPNDDIVDMLRKDFDRWITKHGLNGHKGVHFDCDKGNIQIIEYRKTNE